MSWHPDIIGWNPTSRKCCLTLGPSLNCGPTVPPATDVHAPGLVSPDARIRIIRNISTKSTSFTAPAPSSVAPTFDLNTARLVFGMGCRNSHDDVLASEVPPIHPVAIWLPLRPCLFAVLLSSGRIQFFLPADWKSSFVSDFNVSTRLPRATLFKIRPRMFEYPAVDSQHPILIQLQRPINVSMSGIEGCFCLQDRFCTICTLGRMYSSVTFYSTSIIVNIFQNKLELDLSVTSSDARIKISATRPSVMLKLPSMITSRPHFKSKEGPNHIRIELAASLPFVSEGCWFRFIFFCRQEYAELSFSVPETRTARFISYQVQEACFELELEARKICCEGAKHSQPHTLLQDRVSPRRISFIRTQEAIMLETPVLIPHGPGWSSASQQEIGRGVRILLRSAIVGIAARTEGISFRGRLQTRYWRGFAAAAERHTHNPALGFFATCRTRLRHGRIRADARNRILIVTCIELRVGSVLALLSRAGYGSRPDAFNSTQLLVSRPARRRPSESERAPDANPNRGRRTAKYTEYTQVSCWVARSERGWLDSPREGVGWLGCIMSEIII
ncbi:hypothetical protein C8R43DRAFT_959046 [Mycena crocata]|nr:hypothetical protein C8R43DRAFT_959046 [Mycena crocata]